MMMMMNLFLLLFLGVDGFEWAVGRPDIDRRALAGVWKLRPTFQPTLPMKEFTVYPKKAKQQASRSLPELLLMLKEDGSFEQYEKTDDDDNDIDASWKTFHETRQIIESQHMFLRAGTWDFRDGHLLLAADRKESNSYESLSDGNTSQRADTLLKGRVVASHQTRLQEHPLLDDERKESKSIDTHLAVPKGSINIGKFFYPKKHPSFFEQPMFQPTQSGSFELKQILGALNTKLDETVEEKFQRSDFYNKTFLLTSHPIPTRQPKKRAWSPHPKEKKSDDKINIRVMELQFFCNNTFASIAGLGDNILRGKFDVIGREKDQLWFQIVRFGFGRSVSGSVFSEGRMLSHEDAKAYWGTIRWNDDEQEATTHLEVEGSVLDGWGLEPIPVGRFIMREATHEEFDEDDDDDDEFSEWQ